jgi:LytS/YehU family sensor histidine kinase
VGVTEPIEVSIELLAGILLDMFTVYFNIYYLLPRLLFQNRVKIYAFWAIVMILLNVAIVFYYYSHEFFTEETFTYWATMFLSSFLYTALMVGMAVGLKVFKFFIQDQQKIQELKNINLSTELAYLKDQINPHFLFNSLNNIFVQAKKTAPAASESILLLSDLLRYQLYDCTKEKVYLKGEIEYLQNYLKLDKMRKTGTEISFEVKGSSDGKLVAPFIFIPFLENAVKHGRTSEDDNYIHIIMDILDDYMVFNVKNPKSFVIKQELQGGIGLSNVKRRLELLYPGKHDLKIKDEKESYQIELKLIY